MDERESPGWTCIQPHNKPASAGNKIGRSAAVPSRSSLASSEPFRLKTTALQDFGFTGKEGPRADIPSNSVLIMLRRIGSAAPFVQASLIICLGGRKSQQF